MIKIIINLIASILLSCQIASAAQTFNFLDLKRSAYVKNVIYSDKSVNNLIINIKGGYGSIRILGIPFTINEYKQYVKEERQIKQGPGFSEPIALRMGGKILRGRKRIIDKNSCHIACDGYYSGIALSLSYFGNCDISKGLEPILASIKYNVSGATVKKAREHFSHIMNSIQNMQMPIYGNAFHVEKQYSLVGLTKRFSFQVTTEARSTDVFEFYNKFFLSLGWKCYRSEAQGVWHNDKLFYTWIDKSGERLARLLILSQPNKEGDDQTTQTIYLDVSPYLITEWEW